MDFCCEGIGQVTATFAVEDGVEAGMAVVITADSTVGLGTDGKPVCGIVLAQRNGMAAVQVGGMVKAAYSGTAPAMGWGTIAVDGKGGIKTASGGVNCLIAAVNTAEGTAVIKL